MDWHWFIVPKWTNQYPWSLTDCVLLLLLSNIVCKYCKDKVLNWRQGWFKIINNCSGNKKITWHLSATDSAVSSYCLEWKLKAGQSVGFSVLRVLDEHGKVIKRWQLISSQRKPCGTHWRLTLLFTRALSLSHMLAHVVNQWHVISSPLVTRVCAIIVAHLEPRDNQITAGPAGGWRGNAGTAKRQAALADQQRGARGV